MKRFFAVVCASLLALPPVVASSQSETTVEGRAALERVTGNTLHLSPKKELPLPVEVVMYFSPDGRAIVRGLIDGELSETREAPAQWSIDDQDRLCVVDEGKAKEPERDCLAMEVTGDNVQSVPENVFGGLTVTILQDNPYEL